MNDNAIDRDIGARLRQLRLERRKTLQVLADDLGVSYQQLRKYELGENRISASTLYRLAQILGVRPIVFFDRIGAGRSGRAGAAEGLDAVAEDALSRIVDANVRAAMRDLLVALENARQAKTRLGR